MLKAYITVFYRQLTQYPALGGQFRSLTIYPASHYEYISFPPILPVASFVTNSKQQWPKAVTRKLFWANESYELKDPFILHLPGFNINHGPVAHGHKKLLCVTWSRLCALSLDEGRLILQPLGVAEAGVTFRHFQLQ